MAEIKLVVKIDNEAGWVFPFDTKNENLAQLPPINNASERLKFYSALKEEIDSTLDLLIEGEKGRIGYATV